MPDFQLADVYGLTLVGEIDGALSFMKPADSGIDKALGRQKYLIHNGLALDVHPSGAKTLATRTLPWADPDKGNEWGDFASIHSNPPGPDTKEPALLINDFGKGKVIYLSLIHISEPTRPY